MDPQRSYFVRGERDMAHASYCRANVPRIEISFLGHITELENFRRAWRRRGRSHPGGPYPIARNVHRNRRRVETIGVDRPNDRFLDARWLMDSRKG